MLPLQTHELDKLRMEAKTAYYSLFPAVQTAVRFGSNREVFNVIHRSERKSMALFTTSMVCGTLEEVAALYLDPNERLSIVLDATRSRRLYELARPSRDKPLHGAALRWSFWKPPSKLSIGRDMCFLEYMDSFIDRETGRRVWARSMQSIEHRSCPPSQPMQGPIRMSMRVSGMIFRELDRPNVLEHVTFFHVDGNGLPHSVVQQAIAAHKKAADNLHQVLKIMRQLNTRPAHSSLPLIRSKSSASNGSRDCTACGEHISRWTIGKRCRLCDAILCRKCVEICYHRVNESGKNDRICVTCAIDTSRSWSGLSYHRLDRSPTRLRHAAVSGERERRGPGTTMQVGSKPINLLTNNNAMQSCKYSEVGCPSMSMTTSLGCGSRKTTAAVCENMQIESLSTYSSSVSSTQLNKAEWKQQSRKNARGFRALPLEFDMVRPEPIDLSYLTDLVTPRAGAARDADIKHQPHVKY